MNLWGVINGVRSFVPRMLAQSEEAHIINTASVAGLMSSPGLGIYKVAKHGVVTLSETLYHELSLRQCKIGVSVLCPGFVNTQILNSERNRPGGPSDPQTLNPQEAGIRERVRQGIEAGMAPAEVAEIVFEAIRENRFYILTHPEFKEVVKVRMEDILLGRNPTLVPI